jgi:hypothetical protein
MLASKPVSKAIRKAQDAGRGGRPPSGKKKLTKAKISRVQKDPDFKAYDQSDNKGDLRAKIIGAQDITEADFYVIRKDFLKR